LARENEKCDAHGRWQFCAKRGSPHFWRPDKGSELDLFAGALNDTSVFQAPN